MQSTHNEIIDLFRIGKRESYIEPGEGTAYVSEPQERMNILSCLSTVSFQLAPISLIHTVYSLVSDQSKYHIFGSVALFVASIFTGVVFEAFNFSYIAGNVLRYGRQFPARIASIETMKVKNRRRYTVKTYKTYFYTFEFTDEKGLHHCDPLFYDMDLKPEIHSECRIWYAPQYSGKILYEMDNEPYIERVNIKTILPAVIMWGVVIWCFCFA